MIKLFVGIAIGAAFSKFWIMVYEAAKAKFTEWTSKNNDVA